jgi:hypothetical protein
MSVRSWRGLSGFGPDHGKPEINGRDEASPLGPNQAHPPDWMLGDYTRPLNWSSIYTVLTECLHGFLGLILTADDSND